MSRSVSSYSSSSSSRSVRGSGVVSTSPNHRGSDYNNHLWDAERRSHDIQVRQRNTKLGIIAALSALGIGGATGALGKLVSSLGSSKIGTALAGLFGKKQSSPVDTSSADGQAIAAMNAVGANIGNGQSSRSTDNSFLNWLKGFAGTGSNSYSLTGLLSGLGGIATELGSSVLNYENQKKLIDAQNEYNTPANQMARFAEAGLNPNLIYGMGNNGNQPASGSVAPVDFSTASREAKMQMLNYKMDLAQRQAQIKLFGSQSAEADQRAEAQRLSNSVFYTQWQQEMQLREEQINVALSQARKNHEEADTIQMKKYYEAEIARLTKEKTEHEAEVARVQAEWAETRQFTGAVGDILGIRFGLGGSFSRGRVTTQQLK